MWNRVLSVVLGLLLLGAVAGVIYVSVAPRAGEAFTEFYLLGPDGKAADYPTDIRLGQEARVIIGIVNREHRTVSYHLVVTIDGVPNGEIGPVALADGAKWEQEVSFKPARAGDGQKVEFLLYQNGQTGPPVEQLYLRVDVRQ